MEIRPFHGPLGADITGVDLATIDDACFAELYGAWLDRGVVRIRAQASLDDAALEAFSLRFGPLEEIPVKLTQEQKRQLGSLYVTMISNIEVGGRPTT